MLLTIQNLNVCFGNFTALNMQTPIVIEEGDRIGVIGSNGAGKSTLIKSILGLVPYEGRIDTMLHKEDMAVHMQFNEYTDSMATRYIMEAILQTKIAKNKELQELIAFFEFEECLNKKYSKLSGGQKQRFTIIMVMMQNAPLTFYDEVTSGLDFETRQKLMEKLVEWYKNKSSSLCMVSHYYEELELLADKLLILDKGNVVAYGKKDELFQQYCGRAVILFERTKQNQKLVEGFSQIVAPAHLLAISCDSMKKEEEVVSILLQNNVNYKRSNNDIEMIYMNAKAAFEKGQEEQGNETK